MIGRIMPNRNDLSDGALDVLKEVEKYVRKHGYGPSVEDLRIRLGKCSRGGVHRFLMILEDEGHIAWPKNKRGGRVARAMRVL
jgi:SOS-response transcriptional repressor LexA